MSVLDQFTKQKYLNLETFRRNGEGVKTPVWFVQDEETLYVRTIANSGKVKRIRRNGRVNIVPCEADGKVIGTWAPARAKEVTSPETLKKVDHLLDDKYGIMKKMFAFSSALEGRNYTILEIIFE